MASLRTTFVTFLVLLAVSASQPIDSEEHEDSTTKPIDSGNSNTAQPHQKLKQNQRNKRQYYSSWTSNAIISVPTLQGYSLLQPQYVQIRRPYIIPIWGSPGRLPIYFPPQPLYVNPGFPIDNPPKKYPGLPYLPPDNGTDTSTKETDNKFGEGGPVWDQVPARTTSTTVKPTRRMRKPGQAAVTYPPLVHKETTALPDTVEKSALLPLGTARPLGGVSRPQAPQQPAKETPTLEKQPSRCVWAIISCCSATSQNISYSCFEQLGCTGAFWDKSPCESEFARSAIASAMNYYNGN